MEGEGERLQLAPCFASGIAELRFQELQKQQQFPGFICHPRWPPEARVTLTGLRHRQTQNFCSPSFPSAFTVPVAAAIAVTPAAPSARHFSRYLLGKYTATLILIGNVVIAATAVRRIRQHVHKASTHLSYRAASPAHSPLRDTLCSVEYKSPQQGEAQRAQTSNAEPCLWGCREKNQKQVVKCPSS